MTDFPYIHIEKSFPDYEREPLMPEILSAEGPALVKADFNGVGLDDVYIGNRSIPGGYGLSSLRYILKNNGKGEFAMVQKGRLDMITNIQWADMSNHGLLDLVIVGDWVPKTILINQGYSRFLDKTKECGLENSPGLWKTVLVIDLDKDGRNDILAGNVGLNYKWKASEDRQVKMYLDDFDDNELPDPFIFYYFFGNYVPFASKDKLVGQIPFLKKKFLS